METFDIVVIGAGPGGYPAAIRAAQLGASVAIVEKEQLGGTCLNWGCIPTKALIAAADTFARIKHAETFGITVKDAAVDYSAMIGHKNKVVTQLKGGIKQLLTANGVKQFTGVASFVDRNTIEIGRAGSSLPAVHAESGAHGVTRPTERIGAKRIIIATGSTSAMPGFLPKHERVVESRGFLDIVKLPESLIVLGGGFIGCELACMAAMLGVKVTVVELLEDILLLLDPDVRREVRGHMEKNLGIRVLTGKALGKISGGGGATATLSGKFGDETLAADLLLCAVGRKPVTDGLHLENAGLKVNERGFI
jgi:dihydrolipoamide dehydrogenase